MYKLFITLFVASCSMLSLTTKKTWHYQLQDINSQTFSVLQNSIIVMDSYNENDVPFSTNFLSQIKANKNSLFSYLSIGEAEDYRPYFNKMDKDLILNENKSWEGNFTVKYWEFAWQKQILKYLDQIISQGFDGVYLDIIDAFHRFDDKNKHAKFMAEFISLISKHAKNKNSSFQIILQNGFDIIDYIDNEDDVFDNIDGIAIEAYIFDYTEDNQRPTELSSDTSVYKYIKKYQDASKLVLSVEYNLNEQQIQKYFQLAQKYKFIPLVTDLELKGTHSITP